MGTQTQVQPQAAIQVVELSPKQKVLNLANGEETVIVVKSNKYTAPEYDASTGQSKEAFDADVYEAALKLVPEGEIVNALLNYATSQSYQVGKNEALSKGDFLTTDLRSTIVQIMRGFKNFADMSAADCFKAWKASYLNKTPGSLKVLGMAKQAGESLDL